MNCRLRLLFCDTNKVDAKGQSLEGGAFPGGSLGTSVFKVAFSEKCPIYREYSTSPSYLQIASNSMIGKKDVTDWLAYLGLRIVICGIQSLSLQRCNRLCWLGAKVLSDWLPFRRNVIDENLRNVLGPKSKSQYALMRRLMWHHLLLMVCEIAQAPRKIHRTNWRNHFYLRDKETVFRMMMDERATVMVTGHFGNFELAGFITGLFGFPCTTIARPLDNRFVDRYVAEFRSLGGQHILDKNGAANAVQELLDRGGTVALLADQHAGDKGCWANFLGRLASCHKGLALFVLSSKAPMIVAYNRRLDRPLQFELGSTGIADPRIDGPHLESVQTLTAWYNTRLEEAIRLTPAQYWWVHRRWRDPPAKKRRHRDSPSSAKLATIAHGQSNTENNA